MLFLEQTTHDIVRYHPDVIHVYDKKTPEQVTGVFLFLSCRSYTYVVNIM